MWQIRYYRGWKVTKLGHVEGVKELPKDKLPYEHCQLVYDSKDRVIEVREHKKDKPSVNRMFEYSIDKNVVRESKWYGPRGELHEIHKYIYDDNGILIKGEAYDIKGKLQFYICSKYGDNGELVEESWHYSDGRLGGLSMYKYDDECNVIEEFMYDKDESFVGRYRYAYDENKNLIEKEWYDNNDNLKTVFTFKYDDRGNQMNVSMKQDNEIIQSTEFEFDEIGNPIYQEWSKAKEEEPESIGEYLSNEEDLNKFLNGEITLLELSKIPTHDLWGVAEIGYNLFEQGKTDKSKNIFDALIALSPKEPYFHIAMGAIYLQEKDLDLALVEYNRALNLSPDNIRCLAIRGEIYLQQQRIEEAMRDFKKVLELDPKQKDPMTRRTGILISTIAEILGKANL